MFYCNNLFRRTLVKLSLKDKNLLFWIVSMKNLLHSRYTLIKKLGSGTHGISYLALDKQKKQDVVIKRLRQELTPESRKIWPKESRMLQRLEHQQIPKFIDFFEAEVELELLPHLVQEYVPGQNLFEVMNEKTI